APFGGITLRAHRALLRAHQDFQASKVSEDFQARVKPSLVFGRRMGGVYAGSIFVSLLGLASSGQVRSGERVGIYSYGSGSCAEFYSGVFGEDLMQSAAKELESLLNNRQSISVREYEEAERERIAWADTQDYLTSKNGVSSRPNKKLIFTGV